MRLPSATPGRKPSRAGLLSRFAVAVFLLTFSISCAPHPAVHESFTRLAPSIEIVETHPVETELGHPETRDTLPVWLEFIDGATSTLDLEHFYVSTWPGRRLEPVLDAVGRAAARGVRVRLLIDAAMYGTYPEPADSLGALEGIELRVIDYRKITGGVQHAKLMISDGDQLFVGSQNFDWRALEHIHELGVLIRDAQVTGAVTRMFEMDWLAAGNAEAEAGSTHEGRPADAEPRAGSGSSPDTAPAQFSSWNVALSADDTAVVQLSASPPSRQAGLANDLETLVGLIDGAEREVVAQMLSYSVSARGLEETALDDALRRAAARGVHVSLLVSDWQADSASRIETVKSLAAVPGIEVGMSVVPEYSGGYISFARVEHCKFLVADGATTWVGTSNWGPDYFESSRNVGVTIHSSEIAETVRQTFGRSWSAPHTVHVHPDSTYTPRIHREEAPAGHRMYEGR